MSTVRVYRSTDPGAPAHPSATRGSMAALLRACLVTGYGSGENFKAPAGWEEPFPESGNIAVFRALAGARQFFQIDDTQSSNNGALMRGFDSMSAVSSGMGWNAEAFFGKDSGGTYGKTQWWVVADERTCYIWLDGRYGLVPLGFGEAASFVEDNPYNSFIAGHEGPVLPSATTTSRAVAFCQARAFDSSTTGTVPIYLRAGVTSALVSNSSAQGSIAAMGQNPSGLAVIGPNINSVPTGRGITYPVQVPLLACTAPLDKLPWGYLRGIYYPNAYRPKNHGDGFLWQGRQMLALNIKPNSTDGYNDQMWVDITGSWP